jgi:hypothetical protein
LRLWLNKAEIPYKKRKVKKHRQRRERRAHFGELVRTSHDESHRSAKAVDRSACSWDTSMMPPTRYMVVFTIMRVPCRPWTA